MIHEFAVEPELLAQWGNLSDYRHFITAFGLGQARLLSEFPRLSDWRRDVLRAIEGASELERKRIVELVCQMSERTIRREGYHYEGNRSWLENAEEDHERSNFQLILARDNPRNMRRVRCDESLGSTNDTCWNLTRSLSVPRTPKDLANALAPMLSNCSEAYLIDPHFAPEKGAYRKTLGELLDAMLLNRGGPAPRLVEVITSDKSAAQFFAEKCQETLPPYIPVGISVSFRRLKIRAQGPELHNRFVLTDIGGILLGRGLDKGDSSHSEDMALLDKVHYLQRWHEFIGPNLAFDQAESPVIVHGTKPLQWRC